MQNTFPETPVALTIATSDSGAGAGIQADLLTMSSRGVFPTTVLCALTAQSPAEVTAVAQLETSFIEAQLETIFRYFTIRAAKTGMLFSARNIETVSSFLERHPEVPLVVDPVMVATSGAVLLQADAIETLRQRLLPRAQLITPNLDEAGVLVGETPTTIEGMRKAGAQLVELFGTGVLLKGGHLTDSPVIVDLLCLPGEDQPIEFAHNRIENINTHGSGCTLSAAITAELAKGHLLSVAVERALDYLESTLHNPKRVQGEHFIGH